MSNRIYYPDPLTTLRTLAEAHADLDATTGRLAASRRQAIRDARNAGYTLDQIADAAGITRQRIHQLTTERTDR